MRRFLLAVAVLVAAAAIFIGSTLPPRQLALPASPPDNTIPGIIHVHSARSDGRGTPDEIAEAAAAAGLKFVVLTDHGDATRVVDPPVYRHGVLCLDAVELSTSGGHYIALDMPAAAFPLGGEARDVVEDVKRLGGFGIAAHPDSPKGELRWREWAAPFDAIETVNLDTAWRQRVTDTSWRPKLGLAVRLFSYPIRPAESIASLIQPTTVLYRWEALAKRRRLVTLAGADAHARIGWRSGDPFTTNIALPLPGYVASFRTMSVHVRPERAFTGNATADAAILMRAIRAGHAYSAIDGVASPPSFDFTATNAHGTVHPGDELAAGGALTLHVRSNAPPAFTTTVWNGTKIVSGDHHEQDFSIEAPEAAGVYWVEIRASGRTSGAPWITSNPVYVRTHEDATRLLFRPPATTSRPLFDGRSLTGWRVEQDPTSLGAVDVVETGITRQPALRMRFGLAGGPVAQQAAALVAILPQGMVGSDRLNFTVRAERPMRISVELRTEKERWQRSVYVDTFNQERTVYFDDLMPAGVTETFKPPLAGVRSILFVVDTTNTKPGTSGRIWITRPALQH